ncbi:hypothetical protein GCM10009844_27100 [Nocardioides koreensis]|uniref:Ig-like domain-containing protein n=1 Tax=Nocardioides koreensis TaxID=433651 RepID=A0ABN2ZVR6_9ACTN
MRLVPGGLLAVVVATVASLAIGAPPAVAATAVATTPPTVTGVVAVGQTAHAEPGTWDAEGLDFTYAWLLDGTRVDGATGPDYVPAATDQGHALSVHVVAVEGGAPAGEATSDSVTVLGEAPVATVPPEITGGRYPGDTVQVSDGTWSRSDLAFTYQWLRGGEPIIGAESSSYTLTGEDWCQELTVVVTATEAGYADGTATSATYRTSCVIIETWIPTGLRLRLVHEVVTPREHPVLKVRVETPGNQVVKSGTVTVRVTPDRIRRTVRLRPADRGRLTIRLPRLDPGRHRVRVRFDAPPSSPFMDCTNATMLRVRRHHHR